MTTSSNNYKGLGLKILSLMAVVAIFGAIATVAIVFYKRSETAQGERQGQAHTDLLLCQKTNQQNDILADLIRSVIAAADTDAARRESALFFADSLERLEPRDCDKLPSQVDNP